MYKNILVGIDFSDASRNALIKAHKMAELENASVTAAHVVSYVPPVYVGVAVALPAALSDPTALEESAREHLSNWISESELKDCEQIVQVGSAKQGMINLVKDTQPDLVILGYHDDGALHRTFGSVANALTQSVDCDILLVK